MKADPLAPVKSGDDPRDSVLSASTMNAVFDACREVRSGSLDPRLPPTPGFKYPATAVVEVQNNTGGALDERSVVVASSATVSPSTYPFDVQRRPVFGVIAPAAVTDQPMVLLEPIPSLSVGKAAVEGIAVVDVNITDITHQYARPVVSTTGKLASATSGPARILTGGGSTGSAVRCVVLLGVEKNEASTSSFVWARITGGPTSNGYSWKQVELVAGGTWADTSPSVTGSLNAYPIETQQQLPLVDVGAIVALWPSATVSGKYEFDPEPFDSFWAEITSGPSSSSYSWKKKVLSGTSFADASPSVTGSSNAYPVTMDATVPVVHVGSTVLMWRSRTVSGKFEFEISQFANFTMPGSVSITTQTFAGNKTFAADLTQCVPVDVGSTNVGVVSFFAGNANGGLGVSVTATTGPSVLTHANGRFDNYGYINCNNSINCYYGYGFGPPYTTNTIGFEDVSGDIQHIWYVMPSGSGGEYLLKYSHTTKTLELVFGTGNVSHIYAGDNNSSTLRLPASSSYWVGSDEGITATRVFDDNSGSTHTVEIKGGIITSWDVYP